MERVVGILQYTKTLSLRVGGFIGNIIRIIVPHIATVSISLSKFGAFWW